MLLVSAFILILPFRRGVSAPGVLGLELATAPVSKGGELAAATVLSNMLPANILTYSSPMKSGQTSLASGRII